MTAFTLPTALPALTIFAVVSTMASGYQLVPETMAVTPYLITTTSEVAFEVALLNETSSSSPSVICNDIYFTVIWFGIVAGTVCAVGLIGNTVSVYVLATDTKTPTASFQLIALAVADNTFLLLWCIHYTVRYLVQLHYGKSTQTLQLIRVYTFPVLYMSQMATIWLTVVIAFNRYMAVCWPYRAPQLHKIDKVRRSIAVVALLSVLLNIPRFFERTISYALQPAAVEYDVNMVTTSGEQRMTSSSAYKLIINRTEFGLNYYYQKLYGDAFYYLLSFALPLLVLVFMNACVIKAYRAARKRRYRMYSARRKTSGQPSTTTDSRRSIGSGSQKNSSRSVADHESSVTLVMIVIVLVFVVCQAPARLVQMIWSYEYIGCSVVHYLIHISNTLEVFNSSVNFFIYCAFHRYFRAVIATWSRSVRLFSLRPTPSGAASQFEMAGDCGVQATAIDVDVGGKVNGADDETIVRRPSGGNGSDVLILIAVERTVAVDQGGVKSNGVAIEMFELDQTKQRCDEDR